jgi:hypothetical protein
MEVGGYVPACARVPLSETDFFFRGGGVVLFCACGFFGVFLRAYMPMYALPLCGVILPT